MSKDESEIKETGFWSSHWAEILGALIFVALAYNVCLPYTGTLLTLIGESVTESFYVKSISDYTSVYSAITSFVTVLFTFFGFIGLLYNIRLLSRQIEIQKNQAIKDEERYRNELSKKDEGAKQAKLDAKDVLKEERRKHEELMNVEKENIELMKAEQRKKDVITFLQSIEDRIINLEYADSKRKLKGFDVVLVFMGFLSEMNKADDVNGFRKLMLTHTKLLSDLSYVLDDIIKFNVFDEKAVGILLSENVIGVISLFTWVVPEWPNIYWKTEPVEASKYAMLIESINKLKMVCVSLEIKDANPMYFSYFEYFSARQGRFNRPRYS